MGLYENLANFNFYFKQISKLTFTHTLIDSPSLPEGGLFLQIALLTFPLYKSLKVSLLKFIYLLITSAIILL